MLKAAIIDDEASGRETLKALLSRHCPDVDVIGQGDSVKAARKLLKEVKVDLLFLDIEMADGTGFDVLSGMENADFDVVFVTAYNQYAMKAIKFYALDYILKPVNVKELKTAVGRALSNKTNQVYYDKMQMEAARSMASPINGIDNTIAFPTIDGLEFHKVSDIIRCQAAESYTELFLSDGSRFVVSRNISEVEEMFEGNRFFRIHKSHLINLSHIKKYTKGRGGTVLLSDGSEVEVARRKKDDFLTAIG